MRRVAWWVMLGVAIEVASAAFVMFLVALLVRAVLK